MAEVMGDTAIAAHCHSLYTVALTRLDEAFWMEAEGMYGDMVATPAEMAPRLRRWIDDRSSLGTSGHGNESSLAELRRLLAQAETDPHPEQTRPWLCKSWTTVAPLEAGLASAERALRALERLESPEFSGPWGMYVSGLDRTQSMSINSGGLAVAELAYGRAEQGLQYVRRIAETLLLQMPGAIAEIAPDQGCFVQAWSSYAIAWPVVTQVFGLQPDAHRKQLVVRPNFPASWPEARLDNVRIGSNSFDFVWDGDGLRVWSCEPGWTITSTTVPIAVEDSKARTV
jgi:glycogen debranching enzyme